MGTYLPLIGTLVFYNRIAAVDVPINTRPLTLPNISLLVVILPKRLQQRLATRIKRRNHQCVAAVLRHHLAKHEDTWLQRLPHIDRHDTQRIVHRLDVGLEYIRGVFRERLRERLGLLSFGRGRRGSIRADDGLGVQTFEETAKDLRLLYAHGVCCIDPTWLCMHDDVRLTCTKLGATPPHAKQQAAEGDPNVWQTVGDQIATKADKGTQDCDYFVEDKRRGIWVVLLGWCEILRQKQPNCSNI